MGWRLVFTKQAQKDAMKPASSPRVLWGEPAVSSVEEPSAPERPILPPRLGKHHHNILT